LIVVITGKILVGHNSVQALDERYIVGAWRVFFNAD